MRRGLDAGYRDAPTFRPCFLKDEIVEVPLAQRQARAEVTDEALRMSLTHVQAAEFLEEYARHNAHADLLREMIASVVGP